MTVASQRTEPRDVCEARQGAERCNAQRSEREEKIDPISHHEVNFVELVDQEGRGDAPDAGAAVARYQLPRARPLRLESLAKRRLEELCVLFRIQLRHVPVAAQHTVVGGLDVVPVVNPLLVPQRLAVRRLGALFDGLPERYVVADGVAVVILSLENRRHRGSRRSVTRAQSRMERRTASPPLKKCRPTRFENEKGSIFERRGRGWGRGRWFQDFEVRFQLNGGRFQISFQLKRKVFSKGKSRNSSSDKLETIYPEFYYRSRRSGSRCPRRRTKRDVGNNATIDTVTRNGWPA